VIPCRKMAASIRVCRQKASAAEGVRLDFSKYQDLQPLYTEYNIGHYSRSFRLPTKVDQSKIGAEMKDGVLSLVFPKADEAKSRTIPVN
jgi:HSP20 family protein